MYCQLKQINGLPEDKDLGEKIFSLSGIDERAVVFWELEDPQHLYGHCNFKKDESANYNLKFCDDARQIISTNLEVLVDEFGVKRFLFLGGALFDRFEKQIRKKRLNAECRMIDISPELVRL